MGFDDLPADWSDLPLTDARLVADVLDLVVFEKDRRAGALCVLVCDDDARLVQPVTITETDVISSEDERLRAVSAMVEAMGGVGSIHVAVARRDGLSITEDDRSWQRAARLACGEEVRLLGVHVVTSAGSREVPAEPVADAS